MYMRSSRFTALFSAAALLVCSVLYAADSTWIGGATGSWTDAGNWSAGIPQVAGDTALINSSVTISLPSSITLKTLFVNAPATVTVASGATLTLSNGGGDVLTAAADFTIDGDGELAFSRNGTSTTDFGNIKPAAGVTGTLAARITGVAGAGIELNAAGTLLLTNPGNTFTGMTRISTANGTLAFSDPGALGTTAIRFDGSPSKFVYTGSAPATLTLPVQIAAGTAAFENTGAGTLTLSGDIAPASAGTKTLTFAGTTQANIISGPISNGPGLLNVVSGTGTLILNGTVTGSTLTANAGAILTVGSSALFQNIFLTCNTGSTIPFNPALADSFTATLPLTNTLNGAGVRLSVPAAATASTVTVPALIRAANGSLDLTAPEIGTARNTVIIENFDPGPLPAWFTVNGLPAAYDDTLGVIPATASGSTYSLSALGPSVIPDDPDGAAVINSAGSSGGITLAADHTTIFSLTQEHAADPATVNLGSQILAASVIAITSSGNHLTLSNGTLSTPSSLSPPAGPAVFPALPTPPIAWYDLADETTVTTNTDGRIALLTNKGSLGSALDAAVPSDRIGPRYLPAAVNGLGIASSDGIVPAQGLASLGNAGITGNAPRTAFLVAARAPVTQNAFYALYLGPDGSPNQTFAIVERPSSTSFVTMGNDLEGTPASPPGHNVLTFISGQGGVPNAGEGFRNGLSVGTKTFAFATVDAPIRLLHRANPAANFSGPGEVAEAIVFNYNLSESERAAVEDYLMHKWNISATREEPLLALRNDNPAAELDIPAALTEAYATILSLSKSGPGDVTLGGALSFSGALLLSEGVLRFETPAGESTVLTGAVSGPGTLVKSGTGDLSLSLSSPYSGGTTVQAGTLFPGMNGSLGTGPVAVESGAALDLANASATANPVNGTAAFANPISLAGSGPDTLGALRHSGLINQLNALRHVTLTDDTAVYSTSRFDVRGGSFDFGGNTLTVNGGGEFSIVQSAIANVTPDTGIQVADGMMRFETSDFLGSAANIAAAASGSGVCLYQMTAPMQWSLQLDDNAYFRANNGGTDTNLNRWAGPVTLTSGTARLNTIADASAAITGTISGDGGLLKEGPGWFWLLNSANTYAGATTVTQGTLYAASTGSLGASGAADLTVSGTGTFVAHASATQGWTDAQIESIADFSVFTTPVTTALGLDTGSADFTYTGDLPHIGLKKLGPGKLTLSGSAPDLGGIEVYDGELDLSASGSHDLHTASLIVGASTAATPLALLRLADTSLATDDPGFNRAGPTLTVGSAANSRGILLVGADSAVNGRLLVGSDATAMGAVYQSGGSVTNTGGAANDAAIGISGYGYYRLDDGIFASKGATQFARNSGATAFFEQRGGSFVINPGTAPADGVVGSYYNGSFSTRGGVGIFLLSGGTCNLNNHSLTLGDWVNVNNYNDGTGVFTIENDAQAETAQIILANRNGAPQAHINLNGGALTATYFQKGGNNTAGNTAMATINFNSGVLRVPTAGNAVSSLVRTSANNTPATLNVYAGGAVIDTLDTASITLEQPLRAPSGFGVSGITLASAGAGYLAPPAILITGGSGSGATAVAEINPATGALTAIRVTSPGTGYTAAPTVTLRGGGFATAATATATLGSSASGGLTKLGTGTLNLAATNTYTGPTVVSEGTLRLGAGSQTLTAVTPITVAGGTLDLGGASLTNFQPVVIESGRLINGTLSALSFTKSGGGTATLTAQAIAPSAAAVREAFIQSLGPIIWYDPSDTTPGNIVVDGTSRVSLLRNKGSLGATHDAIPVTGSGPLLLSGAGSPSPLGAGVLQIDSATAVMKSIADVPITGTAPRTLVALLARDATVRSAVGIGSGAEGQTFEIGNDPTKTYVSGIGASRDTQFTANIPAVNQLTFIGAVNGFNNNFARGMQLWRSTGVTLETMTATWPADLGTAAAPFSIGRRGGSTFRGKVGEVLLFDRILTAGEMAALKDALAAKCLIAPAVEDTSIPPVMVTEGTLRLAPGADAIAALAPAVWYDPSDAATVTTNTAGRVTAIVNKGTRAAAMDAGIQSGFQGPLLVADGLTYSASGRPTLMIDANATGLRSAANTDISGTAPRTLIAVLARDPTSPDPLESNAVIGFGRPSTRQLMELADRSNSICYGLFSDDLGISPILPAANANIYMMASTAANEVTGWRSGGLPPKVSKTLGGNWATAGDTPLHLGYRFGTTSRTNFRGQIGEVLLFDRLLTETERADIEDYLVNRWIRQGGAESLFDGVVFNVAEGATLDLGGARENLTVNGSGTLANGTLGAGFVISPAGDDAVGELTLESVTFGTGAEYRLTVIGDDSDRLLVSGDLSALTVVPATGDEITGNTYVIATGAITAKPALSGFPDKFKLIQQGNDLLLTSLSGTLILLR